MHWHRLLEWSFFVHSFLFCFFPSILWPNQSANFLSLSLSLSSLTFFNHTNPLTIVKRFIQLIDAQSISNTQTKNLIFKCLKYLWMLWTINKCIACLIRFDLFILNCMIFYYLISTNLNLLVLNKLLFILYYLFKFLFFI